jgi:hypothetical protein
MPDEQEIKDIVEEMLVRVENEIEFDGRGL